ncbi:MAG: molybdate ABC transporter substrate-binding protein [Burkholderiales bacterium]|nr:molybdate ABC transporter substrate-binding protein [Burkholderiales bacterium]
MTPASIRALCALALAALAFPAGADEVQVAVAANFSAAAQKIAAQFEKDTGHVVKLSVGATGKFYAQIEAGAPFDVLLAADQATPGKLVAEGKGVPATLHTYAVGKLVLWSADPALVDGNGDVLKSGQWKHLSVADARLAPYGQAARETLASLKLTQALQPRIVTAESIGQALQFVQSGNAELGFVALGQVQPPDGSKPAGSMWVVPANLYSPIRQDAVVIARTQVAKAATQFVDYLASDKAREVVKAYGYAW